MRERPGARSSTSRGASLKQNVAAVATWYDKDGGFIVSDTTLIEYNPDPAGAAIPPTTSCRGYQQASDARNTPIAFKFLMGGALRSRDDRPKK